jgi:glutamate synthase (NADPH/NADH) small chain
MPAFPFEFEHSLAEGVKFHWLAQPLEILVAEGRAAGVRFLRTRLAGPDAGGRRQPEAVAGSEFEVPCDLVIPALGQARLAGEWGRARGIRLEGGLIAVERASGRTSNPRYYAGGDCVNGGREVVDAVADGKRAAWAMKEALNHG